MGIVFKNLFTKYFFQRLRQSIKFFLKKNLYRYPIIISQSLFVLLGDVDIYLSPELYAKNKSFLKHFRETGVANVTPEMLNHFRNYLNDQKYSVSKIYGFQNDSQIFQQTMKEDEFVLPSEFKIDFKFKKTTTTSATKNELFEKTFKSTFSLLDDKLKIKEVAPTNIEDLRGQSGYIKKLSEKVNLKSLTHAYEKIFLYDLENVIKPIYTTKLRQEFSIYGLISFSGKKKKNNKLDLIRPTERFKFQFIKDVYENKLEFELSKVHTKKSFNVVSDKVFNFSMLRTEGKKQLDKKDLLIEKLLKQLKYSAFKIANIIF